MKGTKDFPGCRGQSQQLGKLMMGGVVVMAAASMAISQWGSTRIGRASYSNTVTYPHIQYFKV